MKNFWDERYNQNEYVYGTQANSYFIACIQEMVSGTILLPAEGEGRNAVFAAQNGWKVTAFDSSQKGIDKAQLLAKKHNVTINYHLSTFDLFKAEPESFDCIALIYAHITDGNRADYHKRFLRWLKPGGKLILEAFSKEQINFKSGGPQNENFLYSKEELFDDFKELHNLSVDILETELNEGAFHKGKASVIRLSGTK